MEARIGGHPSTLAHPGTIHFQRSSVPGAEVHHLLLHGNSLRQLRLHLRQRRRELHQLLKERLRHDHLQVRCRASDRAPVSRGESRRRIVGTPRRLDGCPGNANNGCPERKGPVPLISRRTMAHLLRILPLLLRLRQQLQAAVGPRFGYPRYPHLRRRVRYPTLLRRAPLFRRHGARVQ